MYQMCTVILDADALVVKKDASFTMEELWRTDAMVFWVNHLLVKYPA